MKYKRMIVIECEQDKEKIMAQWETKYIRDVIQEINDNSIVLPVIQRNLVWDEEKMELLFELLAQGKFLWRDHGIGGGKGSEPLFAYRTFSKDGEIHDLDLPAVVDKTTRLQHRWSAASAGLLHGPDRQRQWQGLVFQPLSQGNYDFKFARQLNDLPTVNCEDGQETPMLWYLVSALYSRLAKQTKI